MQLQALYADMDRAYTAAARYYGFDCRGCSDNCCLTRFCHHTVLEYSYVATGWRGLTGEQRATALAKAAAIEGQAPVAAPGGESGRFMCPLNVDNRCSLYAFRPMICRLHGIPHELHTPGRPKHYGPGCEMFNRHCGQKAYTRFDRTPFYIRLASLEKEVRATLAISGKFKMTVARMINSLQE